MTRYGRTTYKPCPVCDAPGAAWSIEPKPGVVYFECEGDGKHVYTTITARSGMLLEVKSLVEGR